MFFPKFIGTDRCLIILGHLLRVFLQSNLRYEIAPNKIRTPGLSQNINEGIMIVYQLRCGNSHEFEAWFKSSGDYDKQLNSGFLACPICGDVRIRKALMAPAVRSSKKLDKKIVNQKTADNLRLSEKRVVAGDYDVRQALRNFRSYVEKNCENVGENFAQNSLQLYGGLLHRLNSRHHAVIHNNTCYGDYMIKTLKYKVIGM